MKHNRQYKLVVRHGVPQQDADDFTRFADRFGGVNALHDLIEEAARNADALEEQRATVEWNRFVERMVEQFGSWDNFQQELKREQEYSQQQKDGAATNKVRPYGASKAKGEARCADPRLRPYGAPRKGSKPKMADKRLHLYGER